MKTQNIILVIAFLFMSLVTMAQAKQETIKVYGNCGMCKSHIEKAAKQAGATSAVWNKDTKFLTLKFDESTTDSKKIQQKVAEAGYDTQDAIGSKDAYDNLDECCKYERKAATKSTSLNNTKNCCTDMGCCTSENCSSCKSNKVGSSCTTENCSSCTSNKVATKNCCKSNTTTKAAATTATASCCSKTK
jgi:hypothetical protein